jgi:hypothetical protein
MKMFANKTNKGFRHIFPTAFQVSMCSKDPVVEVEATEQKGGGYWGWLENPEYWGRKEKREFCMVWPRLLQLEICFTYGLKTAEEAGQGRRVELAIIQIK